MGVPVRTSVGKPRYSLPYNLDAEARVLYPQYAMLKLPFEEYKEQYLAQLERHGVTKIRNVLKSIQTIHGRGTNWLVLLCYEDVLKKGDWCHRRIFSEWWEEKTGEAIPEIELDSMGELRAHHVTRGDQQRLPDQEPLL